MRDMKELKLKLKLRVYRAHNYRYSL